MTDQIDFAEHGRLLAAVTPGPWQSDFGGFHVSSVPLDYDDVASFDAAPDGEAVQALHLAAELISEMRGYCQHWDWKYGEGWDTDTAKVDAALARFRNITETP